MEEKQDVPTEQKITPEEAMKILQEKMNADRDKVAKEIGALLDKAGFKLEVQHLIQIVPK